MRDTGLKAPGAMHGAAAGGALGTAGLEVRLCRPDEIGQADLDRWRAWHGLSPLARSPFVHPAFVAAAGRAFAQTRVVVLGDAGHTVGFLPLHIEGRHARPPAGALSDGDGIVLRPGLCAAGLELDLLALLRTLRLRSLSYLHMPVAASPFTPFHYKTSPTARIDVGQGLAAYEQRLLQRGSGVLGQLRRKARKLQRECGPLRFELHSRGSGLVGTLIDWKARQVAQRGHGTSMQDSRLPSLLDELAQAPACTEFASVLSTLHAGDRLVALIWSLRSRHHWVLSVPTHDPELADYSPGAVAHLKLIEALCETADVTEIDLGLAVNPLKARLMTHTVDFAQGVVHAWPWMRAYRRAKTWARVLVHGA